MAAVASRVNLARKPMQPEVLVSQRQRFALTAWTAELQAAFLLYAARTHITGRTQPTRHDIISITITAHFDISSIWCRLTVNCFGIGGQHFFCERACGKLHTLTPVEMLTGEGYLIVV
jgi:hypothetical protein